jgi:hypothetical protein
VEGGEEEEEEDEEWKEKPIDPHNRRGQNEQLVLQKRVAHESRARASAGARRLSLAVGGDVVVEAEKTRAKEQERISKLLIWKQKLLAAAGKIAREVEQARAWLQGRGGGGGAIIRPRPRSSHQQGVARAATELISNNSGHGCRSAVGTLLGPPANGTRKAEPRQEAGPFENLGLFRKRRKRMITEQCRLTVRSASANSAAVVFALPWP